MKGRRRVRRRGKGSSRGGKESDDRLKIRIERECVGSHGSSELSRKPGGK